MDYNTLIFWQISKREQRFGDTIKQTWKCHKIRAMKTEFWPQKTTFSNTQSLAQNFSRLEFWWNWFICGLIFQSFTMVLWQFLSFCCILLRFWDFFGFGKICWFNWCLPSFYFKWPSSVWLTMIGTVGFWFTFCRWFRRLRLRKFFIWKRNFSARPSHTPKSSIQIFIFAALC